MNPIEDINFPNWRRVIPQYDTKPIELNLIFGRYSIPGINVSKIIGTIAQHGAFFDADFVYDALSAEVELCAQVAPEEPEKGAVLLKNETEGYKIVIMPFNQE